MSRSKQVHVFVSPEEKDELTILAEVRGLSVSAYLRSLYLADRARYYGGDAHHLNLLTPFPSPSIPLNLTEGANEAAPANLVSAIQNRSLAS